MDIIIIIGVDSSNTEGVQAIIPLTNKLFQICEPFKHLRQKFIDITSLKNPEVFSLKGKVRSRKSFSKLRKRFCMQHK